MSSHDPAGNGSHRQRQRHENGEVEQRTTHPPSSRAPVTVVCRCRRDRDAFEVFT
jgi:hypothetical protein